MAARRIRARLRPHFGTSWVRIGLGVALSLPLSGSAQAASGSLEAPAQSDSAADPKVERARELAQNGGQLYRDGSYDAAIDAFTAAYELVSDPNLLYNISLAHEKAGRLEKAADALDRYRAFAPAEERDKLKARAGELRERASQDSQSPPEPEAEPAQEAPDPEPEELLQPEASPSADDDREPLMGPVGWTLASLSVAGLGTGAALGIISIGRRDDAKQNCEPGVSEPLCLETAAEDLDASRDMALGADISLAVGGAAAVGTVVWVLVRHKRQRAEQSATLAPVFGRGQMGVTVSGRF